MYLEWPAQQSFDALLKQVVTLINSEERRVYTDKEVTTAFELDFMKEEDGFYCRLHGFKLNMERFNERSMVDSPRRLYYITLQWDGRSVVGFEKEMLS